MKDPEPPAPRGRQVCALDFSQDRGLLAGAQRGNRLHPAAILVAERQPVQEVFDGDEAGALEVRRLPRTDAFQELKRSDQDVITQSLHHDRLARADVDLPDVRGQLEWILEPIALRPLVRSRSRTSPAVL